MTVFATPGDPDMEKALLEIDAVLTKHDLAGFFTLASAKGTGSGGKLGTGWNSIDESGAMDLKADDKKLSLTVAMLLAFEKQSKYKSYELMEINRRLASALHISGDMSRIRKTLSSDTRSDVAFKA